MNPDIQALLEKGIYCLGIGGMGMGPLAIYLKGSGFDVSGWDDSMSGEMKQHLDLAGVRLLEGSLPESCGCLVYSSAIKSEHPLLKEAQARGIPLLRRGTLLARLSEGRRFIAVCGSHGKTTSTAMLVHAMDACGMPFEYVSGGLFADLRKAPARAIKGADSGTWLIAEVDESDGTICEYSPEVSLIVNLEWDHPDFYKNEETLKDAFLCLCRRTRRTVILGEEHSLLSLEAIRAVAPGVQAFSFGTHGDFTGALQDTYSGGFRLLLGGKFGKCVAEVAGFGMFNALNALGVLSTLHLVREGASVNAAQVLKHFPGVMRRQGILRQDNISVVEDYAHHPSEIRALLNGLKASREDRRLLVVFQPHRYSRTRRFLEAFADSLAEADLLCLLDVYSAGEALIRGGETRDLYREIRARFPSLRVLYAAGDDQTTLRELERECNAGDIVAFVGAGSIGKMASVWCEHLGEDRKHWKELAEKLGVRAEEPLGCKTTMGVGGNARLYAEPEDRKALADLLRKATDFNLKIFVIGRGSNLVIPDEGVDALVINLKGEAWESLKIFPNGQIRAGAGVRMKALCGEAARRGLCGFEHLEGIPASLGGALRMNAGAMGKSIYDVVLEVELLKADGSVVRIPRESLHVGYRCCEELARGGIVLSALLQGIPNGIPDEIRMKMDDFRKKRMASQPRDPSAGSVFKNPQGMFAGKLIEECGLKGMRIGGAEVSRLHGNFIVNKGENTLASDIIELVRAVCLEVESRKGVRLEPEVIFPGKMRL